MVEQRVLLPFGGDFRVKQGHLLECMVSAAGRDSCREGKVVLLKTFKLNPQGVIRLLRGLKSLCTSKIC
jgi:hypothetical protein